MWIGVAMQAVACLKVWLFNMALDAVGGCLLSFGWMLRMAVEASYRSCMLSAVER